jgi:hypothetical protein
MGAEKFETGLGLWRCKRGHIDVIFDGFTRQECGAKDGLHRDGWCREPGEQIPGWVVVSPEKAERLAQHLAPARIEERTPQNGRTE